MSPILPLAIWIVGGLMIMAGTVVLILVCIRATKHADGPQEDTSFRAEQEVDKLLDELKIKRD